MDMTELTQRGLVLLGCGKMGSAMLEGWLANGLEAGSVFVIDPQPSDWLVRQGVVLDRLPDNPALVMLAVKPQMMAQALPQVADFAGGETLFLSVAAGIDIAGFEGHLGQNTPVVRAMPNTPAAIGKGITAIVGNAAASEADLEMADGLLQAIGQVVRLSDEGQIDAVTGVSGSGPAYVFHMVECLAAAAEAEGLPSDLAMQLAKATVAGAGLLAETAQDDPAQLRRNVTSPNGTTQAGLEVLMAEGTGLAPLIRATVGAAAARSRELANG